MDDVALSVIICTRERPAQLERCLLCLESAAPPSGRWELIVVVNDTGTESVAVAEAARQRGVLPLHCTVEPRPGLSRARNHGIARARGEFLALTDDDCLVADDWLTAIEGEFQRDPALGLIGGRVELADPGLLPLTIRPFADRVVVTGFPALVERLIGCNMAVRRDSLARIGPFDTRLGAGARLGAADDLDFFYRALRAGVRIVYAPEVRVRHAHGRTGGEAVMRHKDAYVKGRGAFYAKHARRGDSVIMRHAYWELAGLLRGGGADTDYPARRALRLLLAGAISEPWVKE